MTQKPVSKTSPDISLRNFLILLRELTWIDFKLRYTRTKLGLLWAVIKPFLIFIVLYQVFTVFASPATPHYVPLLLLGIIMWSFFADATASSIQYLLEKKGVIKNMYFPLIVIPISACLQVFIILLINISIFVGLLLFMEISLSWSYALFILLALLYFLLTLGACAALSAWNSIYADIQHIWAIVLQIGFFISPVIYPVDIIPASYLPWYFFNPLAHIINESRNILIFHEVNYIPLLITAIFTLVVFGIGMATFHSLTARIREKI